MAKRQEDKHLRACVAGLCNLATCCVFAVSAMAADVPQPVTDAATAMQLPTGKGHTLLPSGTTVESARWDGGLLEIDLLVPPEAAPWSLSPVDVETVSMALAGPFMHDPDFAGTRVRVRCGLVGEYRPLDDFAYRIHRPSSLDSTNSGVVIDDTPTQTIDYPAPALRGPYTQADRQPTGALSGVTIFASCGHGWTAGDSSWVLQRPLLLDMNEDHGNIDQLNYFVNYAFNAGATVVPFRPVGWQDIEIVIDNADPEVTYTGSWSINTTSSKYYGHDSNDRYRFASVNATETATARFTPTITVSDFYPVYCFAISSSNRALQTYRISHSGGVSEVAVDHRMVGNGWVWLGEYYFEAGGDNWVEVSNQSTDGSVVIADAIRWGCGMGDIVRPGPGTISGYSRDEEAQRYWAQGTLGNNATGFTAADIWDSSDTDTDDNVTAGARWAAEMNDQSYNDDRWRRAHLEFHTNAFDGNGRGCIALISTSYPTTNQAAYAQYMSDEVDRDLLILDSTFEHEWYDRSSATLSGGYGAISTYANDDEFDATLIELAFHDNETDAELLRDDRVRAAMARASLQGIIKFLHSLPGSTVPLAFAPDPPRNVRVSDAGGGAVTIDWDAPLSDEARGDPATGYVVYQSTNGLGYGSPVVLGNVLSTTISDVPANEARYFRVAATNAGGESMPSEALVVRRPAEGTANVLIVSGFDRLRRQQNPVENIGGTPTERQIWRRSNSFDYVIEHAEALAAAGYGFASCENEAVRDGDVTLGDYAFVVWICGEESTEDSTFEPGERTAIEAFLNAGGGLFVSGDDIAYDLYNQGDAAEQTFYEDYFGATFANTDAGTYTAQPVAGRIFDGLGALTFDVAGGAPYDADHPDRINAATTSSQAAMTYVGGTGGTAVVQFDSGAFRMVNMAFPFEAINTAAMRNAVMQRVMDYLAEGPLPFDYNHDGHVTLSDYSTFYFCLNNSGPNKAYTADLCRIHDPDADHDVDLDDFSRMQELVTSSP